MQLIDSVPEKWNSVKNSVIGANLVTHDHRLIESSRVITYIRNIFYIDFKASK